MTIYTASAIVAAPLDQVFDVVANVELYPEFVPLWRDATVYRREIATYYTEQEVGLGRLVRRFRTKTELSRPGRIQVSSEDPLFREFFIRWDLSPVGNGCRISVALSWELATPRLQRTIDGVLPQVAQTILDAFVKRIGVRVS